VARNRRCESACAYPASNACRYRALSAPTSDGTRTGGTDQLRPTTMVNPTAAVAPAPKNQRLSGRLADTLPTPNGIPVRNEATPYDPTPRSAEACAPSEYARLLMSVSLVAELPCAKSKLGNTTSTAEKDSARRASANVSRCSDVILIFPGLLHSQRNASTGSIFVARCAGMNAEITATRNRKIAAGA